MYEERSNRYQLKTKFFKNKGTDILKKNLSSSSPFLVLSFSFEEAAD